MAKKFCIGKKQGISGPLPISIVIPTYNRKRLLWKTLPSVMAQDVAEIIVVNDGGREDPTEVLRTMAKGDPRFRVLNLRQNKGSSAARNAGADAASSPYVLNVDDDVLLGDRYADTLFNHMQQNGADLAAGRRLWLRAGETMKTALSRQKRYVETNKLVNTRHIAFDDEAYFTGDSFQSLIGAIMLVRRELQCEVRYEETLYARTGWREETDFQIRAARAGGRAMACPHANCFHLSKTMVGRSGGQRAGSVLRYEWHLFLNNVHFLQRHFQSLREDFGFDPGLDPIFGALRAYFGFRILSKIRHLLGRGVP